MRIQWLFIIILGFVFCASSFADQVKWSETATLKTKTVFNRAGKVVYQCNFDKATGKIIGTVLDRRSKAKKKVHPRKKSQTSKKPVFVPAFRSTSTGTILVADTLIKVKILNNITTRRRPKGRRRRFLNQRGMSFSYQVLTTLNHKGRKIVAPGTKGGGVIRRLTRRGRFGRGGRLGLSFGSILSSTGHRIPLILSKRAAEYNLIMGDAAGASIGGALLLGPIGLVGGAFVKGKDLTINAGSVMWVAVEGDISLSK